MALSPCHCAQPCHCEDRSNPLRPWQRHMDCHGAARLAMTALGRHCDPTPSLRPLPRHCEERSNPLRPWQRHMDCHGAASLAMTALGRHAIPPRHCAPTPSLRGTKQSIAALAKVHGLPRRCAPRNDGIRASCDPCSVIARNEAIHRPLVRRRRFSRRDATGNGEAGALPLRPAPWSQRAGFAR